MAYNEIINANGDLKKLDNEYQVEINNGHLLVKNIPYLDQQKTIHYGILVSKIELSGNQAQKPKEHVCFFQSNHYPCNQDGINITSIQHQNFNPYQELFQGFHVQFSFSNKPKEGYSDYYHKMTTYIHIIANEAQAINPSVTPKKLSSYKQNSLSDLIELPFVYEDTNSSRAEIGNMSDKFLNMKIAIIGLGGTGSYILDFVAKTKVKEIHLFDDDTLQNHNAFRSPGAVPKDILDQQQFKVSYLKATYSKMKNGIFAYADKVNKKRLEEFIQKDIKFDFVFICIDKGSIKKEIIQFLCEYSIPFIDVGIGVNKNDNDYLFANVRTTMGDSQKNNHFEKYIPFDDGVEDIYSAPNIQIAEINALNAILAIIRWKKEIGFYASNQKKEYHSVYDSTNNKIINEEVI